MLDTGPAPDVLSFNAALTACAVAGDAKAASAVMAAMGEAGVTGSLWTHTQLMNALARGGELEKVHFRPLLASLRLLSMPL